MKKLLKIVFVILLLNLIEMEAFILPQFDRNMTVKEELEEQREEKDEKAELMERIKEEIKEMFYFGYENYLIHAYPLDELRPISCSGENDYGGFSLTLIDAVDTLMVLDDKDEFVRIGKKKKKKKLFLIFFNFKLFFLLFFFLFFIFFIFFLFSKVDVKFGL